MDIRNVLFLTSDYEYIRHVKEYMARCHSDLCIQHIASPSEVSCALASYPACALIVGMEFAQQSLRLPQGLPAAYFSDNAAYLEHNGIPVFCKYRNGEALYKFITGICAEPLKTPVISAFVGAGGGMGSTTLSAAYARRLAKTQPVLYICLDRYTRVTQLFEAECGFFSRLVLSDNAGEGVFGELPLSEVGRDKLTGTFVIGGCAYASEFRCFRQNTFLEALAALIAARPYDAVVLDGHASDVLYMGFADKYADALYVVTRNDADAEAKLACMCEEIAFESRKPSGAKGSLAQRTRVIVNRSDAAETALPDGIALMGAVPDYSGRSSRETVAAASLCDVWQQAE